VSDSIPKIVDQNNQPVVANADNDKSFYGVEKFTGTVLEVQDNY
jgi:hypothetical protein